MSNIQYDKSTCKASSIGNRENASHKRTNHKRSNILSILSWNIESRKTRACNKFSDPDFLSNIIGHDIIAVQETEGPIKLANYKAFNSTRPDSISGAIAILFKHELSQGITEFRTGITPDAVVAKLSKHFFSIQSEKNIYFNAQKIINKQKQTTNIHISLYNKEHTL